MASTPIVIVVDDDESRMSAATSTVTRTPTDRCDRAHEIIVAVEPVGRLITSIEEFCYGFFHMDECFEWKQNHVCLSKPPNRCPRMLVCAIAHLQVRMSDGILATAYVKKYTNEFRGHTEENLHVEELISQDTKLHAQIVDAHARIMTVEKPTVVESKASSSVISAIKLTLYVTYQPCHHSAGGRKLQHSHAKSCTSTILQWSRNVLQPFGVDFHFKCCELYRAHWEDSALYHLPGDASIYESRSAQARAGLQLLQSESAIHIESMTVEDWALFMSWCDESVCRSITDHQWSIRYAFDKRVDEFLRRLSDDAKHKPTLSRPP